MTTDYKSIILQNLKAIKLQEQKNKDAFKVRAYNKAIKSIEEYHDAIPSYEALVAAKLDGLGKGILTKIEEIIKNGYLERTKEALVNTEKSKAIEMFSSIMAVGPVKADVLVNTHNILTIENLRKNAHLLNEKQQLGLEYYEDFLKRIPRKEMGSHSELLCRVISQVAPDATFDIAGSYRRGAADSGDIDVLFTLPKNHPNAADTFQEVVTALKKEKYLRANFAFGPEKYMGVAKLPRHRTARRIDLMYIPSEKYPFALLYFTGSQAFNIRMRQHALSKGLSLSEHGFKDLKTNKFVSMPELTSERSVFEFLQMDWVSPVDRK